MAREKKVTRTVPITSATVLCLDIETAEPVNRTFDLAGKFKSDREILKAVSNALEKEPNLKAVHVVDVEFKGIKYGMTESNFIANAEIIK